jgi:integrase
MCFCNCEKALKRWPELRIHDLQHTAASWLTIAGTSERGVRDALGHADARMTARYSHLAPEHLQEALDLLGKLSQASPAR